MERYQQLFKRLESKKEEGSSKEAPAEKTEAEA